MSRRRYAERGWTAFCALSAKEAFVIGWEVLGAIVSGNARS